MPKPKLTHKQEVFCATYLANGGNGTKAALAAGYSPKTAAGASSQNLRKKTIKDRIARQQATILKRIEVTADSVAQQHAIIAFGDVDPKKVTIADMRGSLDSLGKHLGMFVDRHHVEGEITFEAFRKRFAEDV
jgi:phage terminase small subunit